MRRNGGTRLSPPEPDAQSQHQVVGVFELVELVADVQEQPPREVRLQRKDLVERISVRPPAEEVAPDAQVDGEDGHHHLGADRQADSKLLDEGRAVEADGFCRRLAGRIGDVGTDVGALVILRIDGQAGAEVGTEIVEGGKVEAGNGERTGHQHRRTTFGEDALAAGGTVEDKVVADVGTEGGPRTDGGRQSRGIRPLHRAEIAGQAEGGSDSVHALVGIAGVAVAVMGHAHAGPQVRPWVNLPTEQQAQVEVGIDARAYHRIQRIGLGVQLLPPEGRAEVPLIVQRQAGREGGDARRLEHVDRKRVAHLGGVEECVVTHADALQGMGVDLSPIGAGREAEAVFHVPGQVGIDGASGRVLPLQEAGGGKDVGRAEVDAQDVGHAPRSTVARLPGPGGSRPREGQEKGNCQEKEDFIHRFG